MIPSDKSPYYWGSLHYYKALLFSHLRYQMRIIFKNNSQSD
ncbi:hypothetical protein HMPREF3203_01516 [Proteus mirabilis]|nr:hypothetical protein HMPREF3203_01516 [Proteus mirabilis]